MFFDFIFIIYKQLKDKNNKNKNLKIKIYYLILKLNVNINIFHQYIMILSANNILYITFLKIYKEDIEI